MTSERLRQLNPSLVAAAMQPGTWLMRHAVRDTGIRTHVADENALWAQGFLERSALFVEHSGILPI